MAMINYKTDNPIYSPGLSTYSPKGEVGEKGTKGTSIYYTNNKMNDNVMSSLNSYIANGQMICGDYADIQDTTYVVGDMVIDEMGDIYTIVDVSGNLQLSTYSIGNITKRLSKPFYNVSGNTYKIVDTTILANISKFRFIGTTKGTPSIKIDATVTGDQFSFTSQMDYIEVLSMITNETYIFDA